MNVCMYVCTVYMYVCMYVNVCMYVYVCMHACMYVCMYVSIYLQYVSIYVCMYSISGRRDQGGVINTWPVQPFDSVPVIKGYINNIVLS